MEIILKKLQGKNFKGLKEVSFDFSKNTNIFGENGTGKTTINDMYNYLITGKDSLDRSTFEIKTLDENGQAINYLEHRVEGEFIIDGHLLTLGKCYREKWNTKKGYSEKVFNGHETLYYINDIPTTLKDYQAKVNEVIGEETFKLLTNPLYFSQGIKWQKAREILLDVLGDINTEDIIKTNNKLQELNKLFEDESNIETIKKGIKAKISRLKKDKADIPSRIDEVNNMIAPEDNSKKEELKIKKAEVEEIEKTLESWTIANNAFGDLKHNLYKLQKEYNDDMRSKIDQMDKPLRELKDKIRKQEITVINLNYNVDNYKRDIKSIATNIDYLESKISEIDSTMKSLREDFKKEKNRKFKPIVKKVCVSCGQAIPEKKVEESIKTMEEYFNKEVSARTGAINREGQRLKDQRGRIEADIHTREGEIEIIKAKLLELETKLEEEKAIFTDLEKKLDGFSLGEVKGNEKLAKQIDIVKNRIDSHINININPIEVKAKRNTLLSDIRLLERELQKLENNNELLERIENLKEEEQKAAQKIAVLEKQEYLCELFVRTKVEMMESNINAKFGDKVSFKLFHQQVNGGIEECCEATVDGVPFSNANKASQINAGLSIINVLCDYYNIYAPIFIDNRESVNEIVDTKSQVINLIVSKDKSLVVKGE